MRVYRRERVAHVWLVNPLERTLEVYRLDGAPGEAHFLSIDTSQGEDVVRAEPFDAIELRLDSLWAA
jgi:hypothetical protein